VHQLPPDLAAAAVQVLAYYLSLAAAGASNKLGSVAVEQIAGLYRTIKAALISPSGKKALAAVEKAPQDLDAQDTLRLSIINLLGADPAFCTDLAALLANLSKEGVIATVQASTVTGDGNVNIQISGSGNKVKALEKPS
jgi:hypothetical protein